jgi:actin-like protein 6A
VTSLSLVRQAVGVVRPGKDGVVGQRAAGAGEKMDVDGPSSAASGAAAGGDVRYSIGTSALEYRKDHMEIENPMQDGVVENWDLMEKLWDHAFKDRLRIQPEEHPMLLAEPSFNKDENREKMLEIMFEKYKVPAVFISKNAVLSSFSCGRSTAVVVDSGGGSTCVAPVHEGYVLQKAVVRSALSGEKLTDYLLSVMESKGVKVRPRYSLSKKVGKDGSVLKVSDAAGIDNTRDSYKKYMQKVIVNDIKETLCRASETHFDEANAQIPAQYELPDGKVIDVGPERFKACELLFNPSLLEPERASIFGVNSPSDITAIQDCITQSVGLCDADIKKDLLQAVILTGTHPKLACACACACACCCLRALATWERTHARGSPRRVHSCVRSRCTLCV